MNFSNDFFWGKLCHHSRWRFLLVIEKTFQDGCMYASWGSKMQTNHQWGTCKSNGIPIDIETAVLMKVKRLKSKTSLGKKTKWWRSSKLKYLKKCYWWKKLWSFACSKIKKSCGLRKYCSKCLQKRKHLKRSLIIPIIQKTKWHIPKSSLIWTIQNGKQHFQKTINGRLRVS